MFFSSKKVFLADPALISAVARDISSQFGHDGYSVKMETVTPDGADILITKGGILMAVIGMKTTLKITLKSDGPCISTDTVGIFFRHQLIPTIITLLFFWPMLLVQICGMIRQSQLDDYAFELIEKAIPRLSGNIRNQIPADVFYPKCKKTSSGVGGASHGKRQN